MCFLFIGVANRSNLGTTEWLFLGRLGSLVLQNYSKNEQRITHLLNTLKVIYFSQPKKQRCARRGHKKKKRGKFDLLPTKVFKPIWLARDSEGRIYIPKMSPRYAPAVRAGCARQEAGHR